MPSTREQVIQAVVALVAGALPKGGSLPECREAGDHPAGGYVNVDDGDPGEPRSR